MPAAMVDANGSVPRDVKDEQNDSDDERMADGKPIYKSWKKKYRKMRITFDQKMHECEELHRQESKALATAKRIAIENDRILDLLLDMNSSAQIPLDKRIDISQEPHGDLPSEPLDVDRPTKIEKSTETNDFEKPMKALKTLLKDVPHSTYAQAKEHYPEVVEDMEPFHGEPHPPPFLTADDVDDYLYDIDRRINPDNLLPTLAPSARTNVPLPETNPHALSQSIAMKNPTSVYNWLRKHAPKTFLQDAENAATAGADEDNPVETPQTDGRRRRGGARGGGDGSRGGRGSRGGKRASLAASRAERAAEKAAERAAIAAEKAAAMREAAAAWEAMEDDDDDEHAVATPATGRGKRKRAAARDDDDGGYRPRGSAGRPAKKKRKSESVDVGTPTISKRGRKSEAARDRDD